MGGILNIIMAVWTAGFHWWPSGNITRTQNVSEYMLVLALCLVTVARDSGRLLYFGRVIFYFLFFFSVHQIFAVPGPIFTKLYHTTRYVLK